MWPTALAFSGWLRKNTAGKCVPLWEAVPRIGPTGACSQIPTIKAGFANKLRNFAGPTRKWGHPGTALKKKSTG